MTQDLMGVLSTLLPVSFMHTLSWLDNRSVNQTVGHLWTVVFKRFFKRLHRAWLDHRGEKP